MNLLSQHNQKKNLAAGASNTLAGLAESRDANNDAMEQQRKQGIVSGLGNAAGMGISAGLVLGGPAGWAIGGVLALTALI